jgi:hypothetical protein
VARHGDPVRSGRMFLFNAAVAGAGTTGVEIVHVIAAEKGA